ncbi:MAG: PadR family transcriptional regulator [Gammaproteobacteria bacterium]|nr:PadR family transcriptional regulator [Gammaproteobacteria bacterium]
MARINKARYAVLGLLTLEPMSGYDMQKAMHKTINHFWSESDGQLYPMLAKLTQEKLVTVTEESQGARTRKIYTITKAGKKALQKWLAIPADPPSPRFELSLKLFFGHLAPKGSNIKHIKLHQHRMQASADLCKQVIKHLKSEHASDPKFTYWYLTVRSGYLNAKVQLKWCDEALELLK